MRILLDTQALLWFVLDDPRLSPAVRSLMMNLGNDLLVSPASYWEIAIKISIGKYKLDEDFGTFMERIIKSNLLTILPITPRHVAALVNMPFHHRDPFDRLLVAQSAVEGVPILSADADLDPYGITRIW